MRFVLLCAFAARLFAADEFVLHTGFALRAVRYEQVGEMLRLHTGEGTVEIPRSAVAMIEHVPDPAPAQAAIADPSPTPPVPVPTAAPAPAVTESMSPRELLHAAAATHGLPAEFLLSIAKVESAFQPNAISPKGAIGVMQLMPETARELNVDPMDPRQNIEGGARLLRDLLLKYEKYPDQVYRALSAYNAGPGAVQRYNGVPPYPETQQYVQRVLNEYHRLKSLTKSQMAASNRWGGLASRLNGSPGPLYFEMNKTGGGE
jgi:hypothetical protein